MCVFVRMCACVCECVIRAARCLFAILWRYFLVMLMLENHSHFSHCYTTVLIVCKVFVLAASMQKRRTNNNNNNKNNREKVPPLVTISLF